MPEQQLTHLLATAHQAPSVGFMQPWRFIHITDPALRRAIDALIEEERLRTAQALGEREKDFARLKVEGVLEYFECWNWEAGPNASPSMLVAENRWPR